MGKCVEIADFHFHFEQFEWNIFSWFLGVQILSLDQFYNFANGVFPSLQKGGEVGCYWHLGVLCMQRCHATDILCPKKTMLILRIKREGNVTWIYNHYMYNNFKSILERSIEATNTNTGASSNTRGKRAHIKVLSTTHSWIGLIA